MLNPQNKTEATETKQKHTLNHSALHRENPSSCIRSLFQTSTPKFKTRISKNLFRKRHLMLLLSPLFQRKPGERQNLETGRSHDPKEPLAKQLLFEKSILISKIPIFRNVSNFQPRWKHSSLLCSTQHIPVSLLAWAMPRYG